jgi:hypothetical protein
LCRYAEDVLAAALGDGARRSGRKTKARVIMIDGEPVLRSNAYSMQEGEPSVFDKELGEQPEVRLSPPNVKVVTPGCQIGYTDHTVCHQLNVS